METEPDVEKPTTLLEATRASIFSERVTRWVEKERDDERINDTARALYAVAQALVIVAQSVMTHRHDK
jgi:hypothetical protein